jgi:tight adherence protein B
MTYDIARLLILVLLFGAIVVGIEGAIGWYRNTRGHSNTVNKRLRLIAGGRDREEVLSKLRRDRGSNAGMPQIIQSVQRSLDRMVHSAGLAMKPSHILLAMSLAVIGIVSLILVLAWIAQFALTMGSVIMASTFAAALGFGLPIIILTRLSDTRRRKVEAQFPVALDVFVRSLRAGHPISSALEMLTTEMTDPIGSEFGIVVDEITYGAELRDALQAMADRWGLEDMRMFVVCLSVQSETGGNLAEILENLSGVIRERASMMMKVRALSSEGRMTATILTALPILAFVGLFLTNPAFYLEVSSDRYFIIGFSALIGLYFLGFFAIRRMIDLKV